MEYLIRTLLVVGLCVIVPSLVLATSDPLLLGENSGANFNPHNLSNLNTDPSGIKADSTGDPNETRICVFCHTPHSAEVDTPLWNRPDPFTMEFGPGFPVYNAVGPIQIRDTLQSSSHYNSAAEYPNGASKLCLSCHDGATAIGTMNNNLTITMEAGDDFITNAQMIFDDVSLGNTHPISFVYNAAVYGALGASYDYNAVSPPYLDGLERMQCTTCHDPHFDSNYVDGDRTAAGTYDLPFWRGAAVTEATEYSVICGGCHVGAPPGGALH